VVGNFGYFYKNSPDYRVRRRGSPTRHDLRLRPVHGSGLPHAAGMVARWEDHCMTLRGLGSHFCEPILRLRRAVSWRQLHSVECQWLCSTRASGQMYGVCDSRVRPVTGEWYPDMCCVATPENTPVAKAVGNHAGSSCSLPLRESQTERLSRGQRSAGCSGLSRVSPNRRWESITENRSEEPTKDWSAGCRTGSAIVIETGLLMLSGQLDTPACCRIAYLEGITRAFPGAE